MESWSTRPMDAPSCGAASPLVGLKGIAHMAEA